MLWFKKKKEVIQKEKVYCKDCKHCGDFSSGGSILFYDRYRCMHETRIQLWDNAYQQNKRYLDILYFNDKNDCELFEKKYLKGHQENRNI